MMTLKQTINEIKYINTLITHWNRKDWIFFFIIIPTTLFFIFLLPDEIRYNFILNIKKPTLFSIIANHYTHSTVKHLASNMSMYFLSMFIIFNIETNKQRFYRVIITVLIVLPILSSLFTIRYLSVLSTLQGVSAITSALIGYIIYCVYALLKTYFDFVKPTLFSLILMLNFFLLVTINNYGLVYVIVTGLFFLVFLALSYEDFSNIFQKCMNHLKDKSKFNNLEFIYIFSISIFSFIILFALPFVVPEKIVNGGVITHTLGHYIGWGWGVSIPWLIRGIQIKLNR